MELQGISKKVFEDRYAAKDEDGNLIERSPKETWLRVAKHLAQAEQGEDKKSVVEDKFYKAMEDFKFIPGGRILSGAGVAGQRTFYNCFVIPSPADSRGGIMESVTTMAEIMARGGGVGVNLSSLRPKGSYVKGVNGTASGAVSFGGLYSYMTGLITQGGSRRGALMLVLDVDHPDIEDFITVKRTMGMITNANLSVGVSDSFMDAVKNDGEWDLKWNGKVYKTLKARELWDMICDSAWASGEPGVIFMERYNKLSNTKYFDKIISTNPCGEQGLSEWGVCNLGSLNLNQFVENGNVAWDGLRETIHGAVHTLDNVIDRSDYFYPENERVQKNARRVGLGTMGLADMLIKLKIRYGSDEAIEFCKKLYSFIRDEAYRASIELAKEKGAFPKFEKEKFLEGEFIKELPQDIIEGIRAYGIRNSTLLTQAPTGTTSLLAGASSGIEPIFDFVVIRKDRLGEHEIMHPLYEEFVNSHPGEETPDYFVSAKELSPEEHIRTQAVIQRYVDSSISKTVNAPNEHTLEDVKQLYNLAYELGCKGVTYFRDGSRDEVVLKSKIVKQTDEPEQGDAIGERSGEGVPQINLTPKPRPEIVSGSTYKIKTGYGTLFVTINNDEEGKPFEVFATIGKTGGFFAAKSEAICRLLSLALRSGIDVEEVIEQLRGIRGPMPSWSKYGQVLSIPDAIGQILREHINSAQQKLQFDFKKAELEDSGKIEELPQGLETNVAQELKAQELEKPNYARVKIADRGFAPECPECHSLLELSEGCMLCRSCGYSKCN